MNSGPVIEPVKLIAPVLGNIVNPEAIVFRVEAVVPDVALEKSMRWVAVLVVFETVTEDPAPAAPLCKENPKFRFGYVPVSTTAGVTPVPEATRDAVNTGSVAFAPSRKANPRFSAGYVPVRLTAGITLGPLDVILAVNAGSAASWPGGPCTPAV